MPNNWFQFKQFRIEQDLCAMKVSTDACIQGAWASIWLDGNKKQREVNVLDIGTGTGVLSLMLAQSSPESDITAIELNPDACIQAKKNFQASPWSRNLSAYPISLHDFVTKRNDVPDPSKYDFIICNPPFFHNHLQAQQPARNNARHSVSLSKEDLAETVSSLLKDNGLFCTMYPRSEWDDWLKISELAELYPQHILEIKPKITATPNRVVGLFGAKKVLDSSKETLVIYREDKTYTEDFRQLLQPYYLAL